VALASRVAGPLVPDFWCDLLDWGVGSRSSKSVGDALTIGGLLAWCIYGESVHESE
jgi:hypothetical protein